MGKRDESYRFQFERLLQLAEEGDRQHAEELCQKLLVHANEVLPPLADFILDQPHHPRLAILLELLGKMGDVSAAGVLMGFLDSELPELRMQAAHGLGWLRARVALMILDRLEGGDPDPDVRHEARIAVEEILRDFPKLASMLRHHRPIPLGDDDPAIEDEAAEVDQSGLTHAERRMLAGLLPRMLALRYHSVPIRLEADGVLSIAVPLEKEKAPDPADLERVTGCAIQLHTWPIDHIYETILGFYEWGDDDWIGAENLPDSARDEIIALVLEKVAPDAPLCALPDCTDAIEAAQSFLSIGAQDRFASALVELERDGPAMSIELVTREGEACEIDAPPRHLREGFLRALKALGRCVDKVENGHVISRGRIEHESPAREKPLVGNLECKTVGPMEIVRIAFVTEAK